MTPRKVDRRKLRFGPYDPPATRRGARLFCEIRGTVVVGGYSDGPIPWPRMKHGGGHCLILCGSLVRAVKREALIAVAHHWGVSGSTVGKWRKALSVPRWNVGSTELAREWEASRDDDRLVRARENSKSQEARSKLSKTLQGKSPHPAVMAAAAKAAKRPRSAVWCKKISRLWKERGHRPPPRPDRPFWTNAEKAMVGSKSDAVIATRLGRTEGAVGMMRMLMGKKWLTGIDGSKVESLRIAEGLSRHELARQAGIHYLMLWKIETLRQVRVHRNAAERLARALRTGPSNFGAEGESDVPRKRRCKSAPAFTIHSSVML
jgi:hypothetical protein